MTENTQCNVLTSICEDLSCLDISNKLTYDQYFVFLQDENGDTMLHSAIIDGCVPLATNLIKLAPSHEWINIQNQLFQTPLHLAVLTDQPILIRNLLIAGASLTAQDKNGNTALHLACKSGSNSAIATLIEPIRYVETKDTQYDIPCQSMFEVFNIRNYDGQTCLHFAASSRAIDILRMLLYRGVDINMQERKNGQTILHVACANQDETLIKFLLSYKSCDVDAKTFDGYTPTDKM